MTDRIPLHAVAPSGAVVGDVPIFDGTSYVPGILAGAGVGGSTRTQSVIGGAAGDHSTSATTLTDIAANAYALQVHAVAGDRLLMLFTGDLYGDTANASYTVALNVAGTAKRATRARAYWEGTANPLIPVSLVYEHTVQAAEVIDGLVTVKPQWATSVGTLWMSNNSVAPGPRIPQFVVLNLTSDASAGGGIDGGTP